MSWNPLLLVGAVIGVITALLIAAYVGVKDKKTSMGFERNMDDGEILRRLAGYARPYLGRFVLVGFLMLFSIAYDIVSPLIVGSIEELVVGEFELNTLFAGVAVYAGVLVFSMASTYLQAVILQRVGQRIISDLREDLFTHIESLSHEQLNEIPVGKLVTRVTNDTNAISMMFTNLLVQLTKNSFVILGILIAMICLNYELTLMVLGSAGRDVAEFLHKNYPDEALGILTYQADGGLTSLRANPLKASAAQLCALLTEQGAAEVRQGIVSGSVLARFAGSPADNELFRQGYYHVEGQASQLAALCVGAAPGETVLDLCAAPGGKTILLAEQMQGRGKLYSCDAAENRVGLIRTAVDRMGFTGVHTLCNDATKPNPALPMADRILTDVPCSGLGILAKKPDLRYKKLEAARQAELLATQAAILDTAAALLKAGGRLVYSTCTIDPAENQQQIAAFLQRHPEFAVCAPEVPLPAGMTAGEHGCLSVPTRTGMDGFFLCVLQKAAATQ